MRKRQPDVLPDPITGLLEVRAAATRKRDLRRTLRRAHLAHLRRVARIAERELPGLRQKLVVQRGTIPYHVPDDGTPQSS